MLGIGEPCVKRSKIEKQRFYNAKRKEKPRKPQFSLNFQFDFGEEEEMKAIQERFVRLRSKVVDRRSGCMNADFLRALLDNFERFECENSAVKMKTQSIAVQANATETVFQLYAQTEVEKKDFQCQWPNGELEAPSCRQVLSPADVYESFFVCGHDSLVRILQETAKGCPCGSKFFHDGDDSVKNMDGHVLRLEYSCERGHKIKWSSSSILSSKYTANCRWGKLCFSLFYVVDKYFWSLPVQFWIISDMIIMMLHKSY